MTGIGIAKWLTGALTLTILMPACSLYRHDHAYVPPDQYGQARAFFIQTGSMDLTERHLNDLQWSQGRVNEALYRLHKEFEVLPEELPARNP